MNIYNYTCISVMYIIVCNIITFPQLFKRNEKGETLLHLAAISGNLAAAKQLVNEVHESILYMYTKYMYMYIYIYRRCTAVHMYIHVYSHVYT